MGEIMNSAKYIGLIGLLTLVTSVEAHAQSDPSPLPAASQRDDDPLAGISLSLDVAEEESKTNVSIAGYFTKPSLDQMAIPGRRTAMGWKLGLEVPIGGSDDVLDSATLDKLGDGTKLSGSITLLSYSADPTRIDRPPFKKLMEQAKAKCLAEKEPDAAASTCDSVGPSPDYIRKHNPSARLAMNRALYGSYWTAGLKGSVSLKRFTWVTSGTLAENTASPSGYSATLWGVYYPSDAVSAWKLEAEYSSAPKQSDPEIICKTVVANPNIDCVSASANAPIRKDALVLRGEYRRFFPFGGGDGGIGMALTGSIDTLTGDYGIEVPVFLSIPGTSVVAPGLKFGYSSKDDDFGVSLFIKTSFSF